MTDMVITKENRYYLEYNNTKIDITTLIQNEAKRIAKTTKRQKEFHPLPYVNPNRLVDSAIKVFGHKFVESHLDTMAKLAKALNTGAAYSSLASSTSETVTMSKIATKLGYRRRSV